ncbi:AraC family transcriptional regulator [Anaerosacchariphilus polymeriproducens]|uniref:AraC family transcriptional regulator n=1 Tax=Anaerosacchariphilus polymeriproducens TaxID=1812858 RepID=A0A371AUM4_9FIRM|nr:helix-turn-helix domain-containing protein [Anaerosacchariphilus polymeriproducens]RDU23268.1 AraC family transcriptional regulator [Anaerosacchariphilus polymeriproducens]
MTILNKDNNHFLIPTQKPPKFLRVVKSIGGKNSRPRMKHKHENHVEMHFIISGEAYYMIDKERFWVRTGDVMICNANVVHEASPEFFTDISMYWIELTDIELPGLPKNCLISEKAATIYHCQEQYKEINGIFEVMHQLYKKNNSTSKEACFHLMISLLVIIYPYVNVIEEKSTPKRKNKKELCKSIKQYLDEHLSEDISLKELSEEYYMNMYYLSHVFKEQIGSSPMQYLVNRRIGEAQTLLEETDLTITEIAIRVGYGDPNQFYALFSKYVGMSPRKYRKTCRIDSKSADSVK